MKGNKIAIDRYLETGEVVDSLDLSVNYLVKSVKEGGTVPLPVINVLTWSKVTTNPSPSDLITVTNSDTSINFDRIVAPSEYPYLYEIYGTIYRSLDTTTTGVESIQHLTRVNLPNVTSIGNNVFYGCSNLVSVNLPKVASIGSQVFYGCSSLISVDLPEVTQTDLHLFSGCLNLVSVNLPKVTSLGLYTFYNCTELQEITIGTETTTVCTLSDTTIPSAIQSIYVPYNLVDSYKSATNWSTYAAKIKPALGEIQSLDITANNVTGRETATNVQYAATYLLPNSSESVTVTGRTLSSSFPQNTSTTDSVTREISFTKDGLTATTTITQGVWEDNNILTWSNVANNPTLENLMTETNTDTSIDFDTVTAPVGYPYMYRINSYLYTQIKDRNYNTLDKTKYIYDCYAPNVTSIGSYAFRSGENLTIAEFPKAVTINSHAFRSCTKLASMNLPKATSLGIYVFYSASNLRELIIGVESSTVCTMEDSKLPSSLQSIYVPDSLVDSYKSASNWSTYADKIKGISERPTT